VKIRTLLLLASLALVAAPVAYADMPEAAHDVKDGTVNAAHKTGEVGKEVGHATANGAREVGHTTAHVAKKVGHGVAKTTRKGYRATKHSVHPDN